MIELGPFEVHWRKKTWIDYLILVIAVAAFYVMYRMIK